MGIRSQIHSHPCTGIIDESDKPAMVSRKQQIRVLIAGIPGSGIAQLKHLVELATGLIVEQMDQCLTPRSATKQPSSPLPWSDYSQCVAPLCGWIDDCASVHRSSAAWGDPVVFETALPYSLAPDVADPSVMVDSMQRVIVLLRHPMDVMANRELQLLDENEFSDKWRLFTDYWLFRSTAAKSSASFTFVRAEDLFQYPEHILAHVLRQAGLWDVLHMSKQTVTRVVTHWRKTHFSTYLSKMQRGDELSAADRKYVASEERSMQPFPFLCNYLASNDRRLEQRAILSISKQRHHHLLDVFGYDRLLRLWETIPDTDSASALSKGKSLHWIIRSPTLMHKQPAVADFIEISNRLLFAAPRPQPNSHLLYFAGTSSKTGNAQLLTKSSLNVFHPEPLFASQDADTPVTYIKHLKARPYRMLMASVPRAGTVWFRALLEAVTGVATGALFPEKDMPFNSELNAYVPQCGASNACKTVRFPTPADPLVVATHRPFTKDTKSPTELTSTMDPHNITYLFLPIRNPIESFVSWKRFATQLKKPHASQNARIFQISPKQKQRIAAAAVPNEPARFCAVLGESPRVLADAAHPDHRRPL